MPNVTKCVWTVRPSEANTIALDGVTNLWGDKIHMMFGSNEKYCMEFYGEALTNNDKVIAAMKKQAVIRKVKYLEGKCPSGYTMIDTNKPNGKAGMGGVMMHTYIMN